MAKTRDGIFCSIVQRSLPAKIVLGDDLFVAVKDVTPQAPVHILVILKKRLSEILHGTKDDRDLVEQRFRIAVKTAMRKGL